MPLPIAHACIGASVATVLGRNSSAKAGYRLQIAGALLAIVPDLDFFFVWIFRMGAGWHRGFAHSIAFSMLVAALVTLAIRADWKRGFPVLSAAMASHCLLDGLTSRLAPGAELFWPFYSRRWAAGLMDYFDFSIRVRGPIEFLIMVMKVSLVEALIFIPLFLAIRLIINRISSYKAGKVAIEQQEIG